MSHGKRIALVVTALAVYFIVFGYLLGWARLRDDWWPLDRSIDGPNLYVSFVWVPLAAIIAWAWSDLRHEAHKAELVALHAEHKAELDAMNTQHLAEVDRRHELHLIHALDAATGQTDLMAATPGDRSIPTGEDSP